MSPIGDDAEALAAEQRKANEDHRANVPDIAIQALAKEVYTLLRRELLLEGERRGWRRIW